MMVRVIVIVVLFSIAASPVLAQPHKIGLRAPRGFEVAEFAGSNLANDIYTMTIDPKGRVVVAGRGYIRILVDDDNDGKADKALQFADTPKDGAMGLLWEKDALLVMGDGGLRRFHDRNADGKSDGPSQLIRRFRTGGEHHAHALRRGPDGWLYVLCGNHAGVDKSFAQLPSSPIKNPVAGCVVRFEPSLKKSEIFAHGFRNAYDMDFNPAGDLFTYDSDNERCVSLPWYEHTRFYHVRRGGFYGWLSPQRGGFWRFPPYFFDVVAPVSYLDRGSPTGVACYRHVQFPTKYQGGMFACDWTFGRVWFLRLIPSGKSYKCEKEIFIQATGDNGFAPTGIAVHPHTGDLFLSIGGRGTRGAVFRVRYKKHNKIDPRMVAALKPKRRKHAAMPADGKPLNLAKFNLPKRAPAKRKLLLVRRLQLALGDLVASAKKNTVWEGYTLRENQRQSTERPTAHRTAILTVLRRAFPSGDPNLDRELSRTLAALGDKDDAAVTKTVKKLKEVGNPVEWIHYLIVLARLQGQRKPNVTKVTADRLLSLNAQIAKRKLHTDRHWPLRIAELYRELSRRDSRLNSALLKHKEFGEPEHALFARTTGFDRKEAARRFLKQIRKRPNYQCTTQIVELLGSLPHSETVPVLRKIWNTAGLQPAIIAVLARRPQLQDRPRFVEGLSSTNLNTVRRCVQSLTVLPRSNKGKDVLALILAMKRFPLKKSNTLHTEIGNCLERATSKKYGANIKRWMSWFAIEHPELKQRLLNPDGVDLNKWRIRRANIGWSKGNEDRGRLVFRKAQCIACHGGRQALGPDLKGVTRRFSRADLLTAIIQPSLEVPPRYQSTLIETKRGKFYQGLIIYQATDGVLLQTGAAKTLRIPGADLAAQHRIATSLMPAGQLDNLTNEEVADLFAYLKSLGN